MTIPPPTARLIFRDWQTEDLDAFHAICSDPDVIRHVGDGVPWSRQKTAEFIERAVASAAAVGFCRWPLIDATDASLVGFCGFADTDNGPEIGWRLGRDCWGRGLATEAARAVLKHGFETLGFPRVVATVQAENRGSIRVVEKLGMQAESSLQRNGREVIVFALENQS